MREWGAGLDYDCGWRGRALTWVELSAEKGHNLRVVLGGFSRGSSPSPSVP